MRMFMSAKYWYDFGFETYISYEELLKYFVHGIKRQKRIKLLFMVAVRAEEH